LLQPQNQQPFPLKDERKYQEIDFQIKSVY
jgi:hypothetical protein